MIEILLRWALKRVLKVEDISKVGVVIVVLKEMLEQVEVLYRKLSDE